MKFKDLDKNSQNFLIEQLGLQIEEQAQEDDVNDYEEPSFDEYAEFFDEFDEDYEMVDGFPHTTVSGRYHAKYSIHFEDKKAILEAYNLDYESECDFDDELDYE